MPAGVTTLGDAVDRAGRRWSLPDTATRLWRLQIEHEGFRLLVDPGHEHHAAPRAGGDCGRTGRCGVVTHGHADHCANLHPLLRARRLAGTPDSLPVHAPSGAQGPLLELDGQMLIDDWISHELAPGRDVRIGPFALVPVESRTSCGPWRSWLCRLAAVRGPDRTQGGAVRGDDAARFVPGHDRGRGPGRCGGDTP